MIVAADNNFADPTGIVGKAVGMIEQVRSTEEGRIKAHQVVRGKKDTLRQKRGPGGPAPFGYRLKKCVDNAGTEPTVYSVLEPDPPTASILRRVFEKAHQRGGAGRLAKCLNGDPPIPDIYKPFYAPTIVSWLENQIYVGIGVWGQLCTDIIDDARVIEPNPHPDEIVRVEDFCEPLRIVGSIRPRRSGPSGPPPRLQAPGVGVAGEKLIEPLSPGRRSSTRWPAWCTAANATPAARRSSGCRARRARSTPITPALGTTTARAATPATSEWTACSRPCSPPCGRPATAVGRGRAGVVPVDRGAGRAHIRRMSEDEPRRAEQLRASRAAGAAAERFVHRALATPNRRPTSARTWSESIRRRSSGRPAWNPTWPPNSAPQAQVKQLVDPRRVVEALQRLEDILAAENASVVNLELGRHIERVDCYSDGRVVLQGTWVGLFDGATELLKGAADARPMPRTAPRRRRRRRRRRGPAVRPHAPAGSIAAAGASPSRHPVRPARPRPGPAAAAATMTRLIRIDSRTWRSVSCGRRTSRSIRCRAGPRPTPPR